MDTQPPVSPKQPSWLRHIFTRENLIALALCLILVALIIATTDSAPQWIYQGF